MRQTPKIQDLNQAKVLAAKTKFKQQSARRERKYRQGWDELLKLFADPNLTMDQVAGALGVSRWMACKLHKTYFAELLGMTGIERQQKRTTAKHLNREITKLPKDLLLAKLVRLLREGEIVIRVSNDPRKYNSRYLGFVGGLCQVKFARRPFCKKNSPIVYGYFEITTPRQTLTKCELLLLMADWPGIDPRFWVLPTTKIKEAWPDWESRKGISLYPKVSGQSPGNANKRGRLPRINWPDYEDRFDLFEV